MVEISDRNSRSIEKIVESNQKLIDLLHRNGIAIPADSIEIQKGAPDPNVKGKVKLADK